MRFGNRNGEDDAYGEGVKRGSSKSVGSVGAKGAFVKLEWPRKMIDVSSNKD